MIGRDKLQICHKLYILADAVACLSEPGSISGLPEAEFLMTPCSDDTMLGFNSLLGLRLQSELQLPLQRCPGSALNYRKSREHKLMSIDGLPQFSSGIESTSDA